MNPAEKYKEYYNQMFEALQRGDKATATQFRISMEELRQYCVPSRKLPAVDLDKFSGFARSTLGQSHNELSIKEASNCINAAFNFHSEFPVLIPYTTMDFLRVIQSQYSQLQSKEQLCFGDLVVFWSRVSDEWRDRKILVRDLFPETPGFPFGLVFDHVAIYVDDDCLYHKPDPTLESRYQINHWDDVVGFSEVVCGFELTFHRRNSTNAVFRPQD